MLLVIGNPMLLYKVDEVIRSESSQRRSAEVGIVGQKVLGAAAKIREVTSAAPGDQNLFCRLIGSLKDRDTSAEPSGFRRAQEPGSACAQYQNVKFQPACHGLPSLCNLLG